MALPVSHIMRSNLVFCEEATRLVRVGATMLAAHVGSIVVRKGEQSVGIITSSDLIRAAMAGRDFEVTQARDIMSAPIETCDSGSNLDEVLALMERTGRGRIVVTRQGRAIGIVKRTILERFKGISGLYTFSPKTHSLPFRRGSGSSTS